MNKTPANHSATVAIAACIHEGEKLQEVVLYALGDFKFIKILPHFSFSLITLLTIKSSFGKEQFMVSNSVTLHSVSAKILHTDQVKMAHKSYCQVHKFIYFCLWYCCSMMVSMSQI